MKKRFVMASPGYWEENRILIYDWEFGQTFIFTRKSSLLRTFLDRKGQLNFNKQEVLSTTRIQ